MSNIYDESTGNIFCKYVHVADVSKTCKLFESNGHNLIPTDYHMLDRRTC